MYFSISIASLVAITIFFRTTSAALWINCRSSIPFCYFARSKPDSIMEIIGEAVWASGLDPLTIYFSGESIACVTIVRIGQGDESGICLFSQGTNIRLEKVRLLINALIEHGCKKYGSIPIHYVDRQSNDPRWGILTFNYVGRVVCTGKCIPGNRIAVESSSAVETVRF